MYIVWIKNELDVSQLWRDVVTEVMTKEFQAFMPTFIEISIVTTLLALSFGYLHSFLVLSTILSYISYTIFVTQWRILFRKQYNAMENEASGRGLDSLLNYEAVKYCNN